MHGALLTFTNKPTNQASKPPDGGFFNLRKSMETNITPAEARELLSAQKIEVGLDDNRSIVEIATTLMITGSAKPNALTNNLDQIEQDS